MKLIPHTLAAGACAAFALFGASGAWAQAAAEGTDYHPLYRASAPMADVNAGAVAAAHASGTEAVGQSTAAPAVGSMSRADVYQGAVAAAHASGTEAIGQSTAAPSLHAY